MKITRVETFPVRVDMARPRGPSILSYRQRQSLFLKVSTDAGLVGWGETYLVAGATETVQKVLAPILVGRDPLDVRRLWREMSAATFNNGFVLGGIDIALHDLWGKALGVPIHQLYGGAQRTRLPVYASLPGYEDHVGPEEHWEQEAVALVEGGFRAMKLRIGRFAPARELPVIARVREALPADVRLLCDANAAYTLPTAVRVGRALYDIGLDWFEEPLSQVGYHGYPALRAKLDIALAGGEGLQTRASYAELLGRGAVDIVQPDVSICGGIAECLFVADLARLSAVQTIPHCWGGAVMLAATAHVVAVLPSPSRLEGFEDPMVELDVTENPFRTDLIAGSSFEVHDGTIALPTGPGLGVEPDEALLRRYAIDG
ncbi:MAG: mandelate racemase/muconate lactonizing enzyme family protein [Chloroflexi bacterium]|nr:mandelate racemase/muconate lactonizing enzyme family protein [Chloroflexota bacterium]